MHSGTVFVGGPIQYAINNSGGFDAPLKLLVESTLSILDMSGYVTLSAHRHEGFGKLDVSDQQREVCSRDRAWMEECDCFVAILPSTLEGYPIRTEGTAVELGWASALGKKIIILQDPKAIYSHLIAGLESVADVTYIDIKDFLTAPSILVTAISEGETAYGQRRGI